MAGKDLLTEMEECETNVWEALLRGDMEADQAALHTRFLGVYPDGFASRSEHVQQLENGPTISSYKISEQKVLQLGRDLALFSYRADFTKPGHNESEVAYVSSIWERHDTGWLNIFSQDTPGLR
jgi:hypothetical protein